MLVSVKRFFIILVIITVVAFAAVFLYSQGRTFYNDENVVGNTTGNIINGGLFCERDGKIYFSNDNDDGSLYVMNSDCTNARKISNDKTAYINVDDNYIYYLRANNTRENNPGSIFVFYNTGLYRIDRKGNNLKSISSNPASYVTLKGNTLYYQNYELNIGLFLYQKKIDGTMERLLLKDAVIPSAIIDNKLYYAGYVKDHNINALDLSSFVTETQIQGNFAYPIFLGDYIYYLDMDNNYSINRMKTDGSEQTVLVEERCSTYNITNSGKFLYYQVDDGDNSGMCRLNLETMESETLLNGNYKQIHVTNNYVFFKEFDNKETYVLSADGSAKLGTFDPPGKEEESK